ncbi:four-carbon acid sugar kinase family protein [Croceicoccus ponticola]|uniref:3-oxo-tetronate kinase n=1 Tax=Croceicoccus ponticola TaxID=2217664 RepID=A0A437GTY3_9SPHN|nr:3-oxo-tetronate kinase [Croceicoccus ponticola]RVQ64622.1 four-carbon acid sugar kinase family protein [Croceicoccus ponticola]
MILGCIADDFTGAGDIAGLIAAEGMRTSLFTSVDDIGSRSCEAGVVALKTRSLPVEVAVQQSLAALELLLQAGCSQIVFKYCSTFDSTPRGNIGPVAEALAARLGVETAIVCPSFPANGRTVYQGNLFVGDVPLAESGMRDHPLTPMTDSDLRRWLAPQTSLAVAHIPLQRVRSAGLADDLAMARGLVVVDAVSDQDLRIIARAVADAPLVTGGSAIGMGLPANFRARGQIGDTPVPALSRHGPTLILSGSCSVASNAQVAAYRASRPAIAVDVERLLHGYPVLEEVDEFLVRNAADSPLAYSTAPPELSRTFIEANGGNRAALAVEELLAELATRAAARGIAKFVVAGGETSGGVVEALQPGPLQVGRMIAPGVPLLANETQTFALKSGNFGSENFLHEAVAAMEPTT